MIWVKAAVLIARTATGGERHRLCRPVPGLRRPGDARDAARIGRGDPHRDHCRDPPDARPAALRPVRLTRGITPGLTPIVVGRHSPSKDGLHQLRGATDEPDDVDDLILNYDPEAPQARFRTAGLTAAFQTAAESLPHPVPWPAGSAPAAAPLNPAPVESDDLTRFHGYDRGDRHVDGSGGRGARGAAHSGLLAVALVRVPARHRDLRAAGDGRARAVQRLASGHGALLPQPRPLLPLHDWQGARGCSSNRGCILPTTDRRCRCAG